MLFTKRRKTSLRVVIPKFTTAPTCNFVMARCVLSCFANTGLVFSARLLFYNHLVVHKHIEPEGILKHHSFILKRYALLSLHLMSSLHKFNRKKRLIHRFEQPRPKLSMQLDRSVKNISCYLILRHNSPPRLCASARDDIFVVSGFGQSAHKQNADRRTAYNGNNFTTGLPPCR